VWGSTLLPCLSGSGGKTHRFSMTSHTTWIDFRYHLDMCLSSGEDWGDRGEYVVLSNFSCYLI
jgi:hypothetical protein